MLKPPKYCLCVQRDFVAQHYLIGGDWGAENQPHSHHFVLELRLHGSELDEHGYMVDIVDVERELQTLVAVYRDQLLNDLAPFAGLNPSIENFARILCGALAGRVLAPTVRAFEVRLWENEIAWASCTIERV
ncbi:MAG: 6-carboxytetrahydropterin synthase [Chloroflexi bacterium]|nr:MAG: 6-carboxytetrahydropterin synthase [Chloroflexota bacterium]